MTGTSHRMRTRVTVLLASALVFSWLVAGTSAQAASSPVKIKTTASQVVAPGATTPVLPRYSARRGVRVVSATVDVRHGSRWIVRGVRHARVTAGTYKVTTRVTYRSGSTKRKHRVWRTQTLRVTHRTQPAPVERPATVAPATVAPLVPSLARTSTACDDAQLVKPDGTPWTCTFSDEFSGTQLDRSKWLPQTTAASAKDGYQIGADCFVDDPDNVSVSGGSLALTVRKEAQPFECQGAGPDGSEMVQHTAGSVSTWGRFAQARGRFEFRASFPALPKALADGVAGPHSALWLYPAEPASTFPFSGEIDVLERYPQWPDYGVPYIHYQPVASDPSVTAACRIADPSQFHTYTVEWTPTTISIAYDGVTCVSHTITALDPAYGPAPFDRAFMLVLTQGLEAGATTAATPTTGTTKVDYVRVWK